MGAVVCLRTEVGSLARILVTGGAGYVGSMLTPRLLDAGHDVRVLDNLMYRQTSLLPYFLDPRLEFIRGDVRDRDMVKRAVSDVDFVVHLAAIVGAPACARSPELAEAVNYEATVLLDECRNIHQGFIFASTGSNYGAVDGVCTEETPLRPLSVYGVTKTNAEAELLESGNAIVYRFATAFGLSRRLRLDLLINDFAFQAVKNRQLIIYEGGFRRTFIHVQDMASAFVHAIDNYDGMRDEAYNVGHESMNYTKREVAEAIRGRQDYDLYNADVGSDPDQRDYEVSYQKIRNAGFETSITLERGIDELIRGFQMVAVENPYSNIEE